MYGRNRENRLIILYVKNKIKGLFLETTIYEINHTFAKKKTNKQEFNSGKPNSRNC